MARKKTEKRFCGNCARVNENGKDNKCSPFWDCLMKSNNFPYWEPAEEKKSKKDKLLNLITTNGICLSCEDRGDCPMIHKDEEIEDLWDVHPVELNNLGEIDWCPMYYKEKLK